MNRPHLPSAPTGVAAPDDEFASQRARAERRLAAAQASRPAPIEVVHAPPKPPPPKVPPRVFRNYVPVIRRGPGRPRKEQP